MFQESINTNFCFHTVSELLHASQRDLAYLDLPFRQEVVLVDCKHFALALALPRKFLYVETSDCEVALLSPALRRMRWRGTCT
jgi:hypothetical protein